MTPPMPRGLDAPSESLHDLSVVVPLYNEEESIDPAVEEILGVLDTLDLDTELILVNDGSIDGTGAKAVAWHEADPRVKVIEFRRNFGQTAGISAGFQYASSRVVVVMDGDQQNDPADIPTLLAALAQGYDVASGWRKDRKDKLIMRRIPSRVANWLISRVTGLELHDYGCTLKAYDKEVIDHLELFGELHRFIPALTLMAGANVIEIPVNHRAREHGTSKYGISRLPRVLLDLLTVKFLIGYRQKPMQFFGRMALACLGGGAVHGSVSALHRHARHGRPAGGATPWLLASLQFASFGIIGELLTRLYYRDAASPPYVVRRVWGSGAADPVPAGLDWVPDAADRPLVGAEPEAR